MRAIESFDSDAADLLENRWDRLNRIIDGKRILFRFVHQDQLKADYRFMLAARISEHRRIDDELVQFIDEVKSHFRH